MTKKKGGKIAPVQSNKANGPTICFRYLTISGRSFGGLNAFKPYWRNRSSASLEIRPLIRQIFAAIVTNLSLPPLDLYYSVFKAPPM